MIPRIAKVFFILAAFDLYLATFFAAIGDPAFAPCMLLSGIMGACGLYCKSKGEISE